MPNTNDLIAQLAGATPEELIAPLQEGKDRESLVQFLGQETVEALEAEVAPAATRSAGPPLNIVVLPGLMGSLLKNRRNLLELLWISPLTMLRGLINRLQMAPDGLRDLDPQVEVIPAGLELASYTRLSLALRRAGQVFTFPYDWRRDIGEAAALLKEGIDGWAARRPGRPFLLVGHSMGGLVAHAYMARFPAHAVKHLQQVVMLGTPLRGSIEAVYSLAGKNPLMDTMVKINPDNQPVTMVRSLPGLYQLLPAPPDAFPGRFPYPADFDLYRAETWPLPAGVLSQRHLDGAKAFHQMINASDPQLPVVQVAGSNLPTRVAAQVQGGQLRSTVVAAGTGGGDGTVPHWSSALVDGMTYYVEAEHMKLPAERQVIEAVLAIAREESPGLPLQPPATRRAAPAVESEPDLDAQASHLREVIEAGTATAQDLEKLFFVWG